MDKWCDDCGARWREQCVCLDQPPFPTGEETWVGMDGHAYIGDPSRASLALHDPEVCPACRSDD